MNNGILPVLGMLAIVVAILAATYLFTKYVVGRTSVSGFGGRTAGEFRVLCQLNLGKGQQRLVIVQLEKRCLLLGVASESINLLAELTPEEAEKWLGTDKVPGPTPPSFTEAMRNITSRKK